VIASEVRLQLLWALFEHKEMTVKNLALELGMSPSNASLQLKQLRECGLVCCGRRKMEVFYRAEANEAIEYASELSAALRACFERSVSLPTLIRHATAFTHVRRIEIFKTLHGRSLGSLELCELTGMSPSALFRHLDKLIRRGYVKEQNRTYRVGGAGNALGRTLLKLAAR
jgi:DNA-binding transcriptional ArsR family regulator